MFYSFTEKDDKGKTPNKAARAYHLALKCTETWFSTCFDAAIDPNIPNRNPVYAGTRMCDTGNSVDVRIKFAVYLESYGNDVSVETIVDNDNVLLGNLSCHSSSPE